tara:strand:+ start:964 stop:1269 length:306 start_codon:yes stop_codon:yes gene_type:complete
MANRLQTIAKRLKDKKRIFSSIIYPKIPVGPNDFYIISKSTDRLDKLAYDFYKDPNLWWVISKANPDIVNRDSFFLNPGLQVRIPQNIQSIYEAFIKLNKK